MTTRFPKARKRRTEPAFLATARAFYGDAFGTRRRKDLAAAIEDWSDLSDEEQTFAQAHLAWLDLVAQAGTQRLLVQVRDLLEEMVEAMQEALDEPPVPMPAAQGEGFAGEDEEDDGPSGLSDLDDIAFPEPDELPDLDEIPGVSGDGEPGVPEDLAEPGDDDLPEPTEGEEGS